jgi:hypothetical protein
MYVNNTRSGKSKYILQVQCGQIAMLGTWFSHKSEYKNAYEEFINVVSKDNSFILGLV